MPNYGKFLKELISNKHKIEQILAAFLSNESSAMIQNKVPPKLEDPGSFLIPRNFNKTFSCNALADLGASINLMPYFLYAKLSLKILKPTKMSIRLVDRSFQYPIGIPENMLIEVGKFIFPADFVILKMEEDNKVSLILGRPFLYSAEAVIRVKQKQLNLGVGTERMIFNIDSAMKHSYLNDDTRFSIEVIDEILEEDFDALLDEESKILPAIEGTLLEEEIFSKFNEFMAMTADENFKSESDTEEPPFEKITINTEYKIKTSLEEPSVDLELKPLLINLEYVFLEEPSFLPVIISSKLSTQNKSKLVSVLKKHKQAFAWKTIDIPGICPSFYKHKIQLLDDKKQVIQKQKKTKSKHKGDIIVVTNENDELVPTRIVMGWRVCIDYHKLNEAIAKDHFPLLFIDQMLKRLTGNKYFCFLDAPFQRCMLAIFRDMIEESVEVFMDEFSVFGNSFDKCLNNLDKMLQRCKDAHLVFNWEKCHFMVKEGIVFRHKVSSVVLEVDKAKINVISKFPPPTNIKGPLTKLLEKDTPFEFDDDCQKAFELLKEKLTYAPVIISLNWNLSFELMCDASDFAVGAVLVIEKELLAIVFAFEKFRSYLILSKTIVHTDHSALKHLFKKQDAKPRLIRYILLLQEFDIEIKDRKGTKNVAADHLSRIKNEEISDDSEMDDNLPEDTLMEINTEDEPWFADFANYLVADIIPKGMTYQQKKKFFSDLKHYFWEEPYLFKVCSDGMIRCCVSGLETQTILDLCHNGPTDGHYRANVTAKKVLDLRFYWPIVIKEAHTLVQLCEACQKMRNISKRDEMPLNNIQVSRSSSFTNRFEMPKALISDRGTHSCNKIMEKTMKRYRVNHHFSTSYHPQTSGQVENTNKALKRILEKAVKDNPAIWSRELDDALWAFQIAYKTPTGTIPYKLIYGKNCYLLFEIEYCAYWTLKNCNPDLIALGEK
uniref:RNA-directed DNA polymerase n=1 Tax=Tanacetum cinerariifolium TaxID=118510 RepID=A0A6L2J7G6_TANCI|nr:reverse transcriptase domain-containing protein [Tanacetum cinerariifolium]